MPARYLTSAACQARPCAPGAAGAPHLHMAQLRVPRAQAQQRGLQAALVAARLAAGAACTCGAAPLRISARCRRRHPEQLACSPRTSPASPVSSRVRGLRIRDCG